MNNEIRKALEALVAKHGIDAMTEMSKHIGTLATGVEVPLEHMGVLHPKAIENTVAQLEGCVEDILAAGTEKEDAFENMGDLKNELRALEAEIELTEAQGLMALKYEGKNMIAIVGLKEVPLNNDTTRTAYRRSLSADLRKRRAFVNGQIDKLQSGMNKAQAAWETANEAGKIIGYKADIQARLLSFLGGK